MEFLVKVTRLGSKAVVFGLAEGDDKTAQFEVKANDYISDFNLSTAQINPDTSIEEAKKTLQDIFISPGRLNDLGALLKISIIQKLAPGISKEGYEEDTSNTTDNNDNSSSSRSNPPQPYEPTDPEPARPHPFPHDDPLRVPSQGPRPLPEPIPGFEDEYEINRPARGLQPPGRSPFGYGEQDLYPPGLGPHDPLRPSFGGGGLPRPGGGMHPTFDDPLFGGGGGVGGYDPRAPPGARYDPLGPGDGPRDRNMGPRFPGGRGGGPPNPFGGFGDGDFF
jgi:hypothetical protein